MCPWDSSWEDIAPPPPPPQPWWSCSANGWPIHGKHSGHIISSAECILHVIKANSGNSTFESQVVTRKSPDPQNHVLEQSTKSTTSHDLHGNSSTRKHKDHTYHMI